MDRKVKKHKTLIKGVTLFAFASFLLISSLVWFLSPEKESEVLSTSIGATALEPTDKSPIVHKVLVVIYDTHELDGHRDYPYINPRELSQHLEGSIEKASKYNGVGFEEVDIQIVGYESVNKKIPHEAKSDEKYFSILDQFTKNGRNLCQRVVAKEFDEVWVWADRTGGLYEAVMIGPYDRTYNTNGGPFFRSDCTKPFHLLGLNYERDPGSALHSFEHRVENTIARHIDEENRGSVTRGDTWYSFDGAWDVRYDPTRFGQPSNKPQCLGTSPNRECWITPDRTCGRVHFPPNAVREYTYDSQFYATNKCINWNPQKSNSAQTYNCDAWGCTQEGFFIWWNQRMPGRCSGMKTLDGKDMPNWWWLILKGYTQAPDWGCEVPPPEVPGTRSNVDERFGVGGSCNTSDKLGLNTSWNYAWGNTRKDSNGNINLYNSGELGCIKQANGNEAMFTLGKVNWNAEGVDASDVQYWLNKAKADGYWTSKDQQQFDQIKRISESTDIPDGKFRAPHRMQVGYIQIPYIVNEHKGGYYQIANEPDIYQYIPPTGYAVYYHNYYERVKRFDPTAKVTVGGLGYPDYNHPFKDQSKYTAAASEYPKLITYSGDKNKYPMYHVINSAPSDKKEVYRSGAWLVHASIKYKEFYNRNIPVDFWSIHPYPWSLTKVTNPSTGYVGNRFNTADEAVNDTINQLRMFKKVIALPEINQADKPIWITEYSIIHHNVITKNMFIKDQERFQAPYLEKVTKKAIDEDLADKFFYFVASKPKLNNKTLLPGDRNIIGVPAVYNATSQPYPKNIKLPNENNINSSTIDKYRENKSKIGEITAFNFFHMKFKKSYTIQLMTDNFHIFYLEYPEGERDVASNTKWTYAPPEKWAGGMDTNLKLQAFNTYWDPIRNLMIQQVVAGNKAYAREASCSNSGCSWPRTWTDWGYFMENVPGAAGKNILAFDTRVMEMPNGDKIRRQHVVVEGNKVFNRVNKPQDGRRVWTDWQARGVWKPADAASGEIIMDVYGSDPYKSNRQYHLDMFTYDPVRRIYKFYSWDPTWTTYLMKYDNDQDTPVLQTYKRLTTSFTDTVLPTINTLDRNFFSKSSSKLIFTVKGSDSGSGVTSYHYGVGRSAGLDFGVVPAREYMSTSNNVTIDLKDPKLNTSGTMYLNVYSKDAYGNTSKTKSIKLQ